MIVVLLGVLVMARVQADDYWSTDFDVNRNCQQDKLIAELQRESPSRCASTFKGSFAFPMGAFYVNTWLVWE